MGPILDDRFYRGTPDAVAVRLLGKLLVRQLDDGTRLSGIVVEVEAYLSSGDPASHSYGGKRNKNRSMFAQAGTLYVYPIHSRHCLNVVTERENTGSAVLIRAIEPIEGIERMAALRKIANWPSGDAPIRSSDLRRIATGPGRLCQAMDVDRRFDGIDLRNPVQLWLENSRISQKNWESVAGPRIGITQGKEMPLRWFIDGHHLVSGCARDHSAGRTWRFKN